MKEVKSLSQKYICTLIFIVLLFPVAKEVEVMQLPIHVWACTHTHTHTHTHTQRERKIIHSWNKKAEKPAICEKVDGLWGDYTWWNKSEKDKHCMISLKSGI